jgi:hypothetical protein
MDHVQQTTGHKRQDHYHQHRRHLLPVLDRDCRRRQVPPCCGLEQRSYSTMRNKNHDLA